MQDDLASLQPAGNPGQALGRPPSAQVSWQPWEHPVGERRDTLPAAPQPLRVSHSTPVTRPGRRASPAVNPLLGISFQMSLLSRGVVVTGSHGCFQNSL